MQNVTGKILEMIKLFGKRDGAIKHSLIQSNYTEGSISLTLILLTFWRRNYFFNFSTPVYKM